VDFKRHRDGSVRSGVNRTVGSAFQDLRAKPRLTDTSDASRTIRPKPHQKLDFPGRRLPPTSDPGGKQLRFPLVFQTRIPTLARNFAHLYNLVMVPRWISIEKRSMHT
jgi:hypothetical protein